MLFCIFSKYGLITSDNFYSFLYDELQSSLETSYLFEQKRMSIGEIIDVWIKRRGFPTISVVRHYTNYTKNNFVTISVSDDTKPEWYVPVSFMKQPDKSGKFTLPFYTWSFFWISPQKSLEYDLAGLGHDKWFMVNLQRTGEC